MKGYRRSILQVRILICIQDQETMTLTELADRVNAQRPSVSRSIRTLKEQGLVYRDRKGWHLTDTGETETFIAKENMLVTAGKLTEVIKNVEVMMKEFTPDFSQLFREACLFDRIVKHSINPELLKTVSFLVDNQTANFVRQMNESIRINPSIDIINQQFGQIMAQVSPSLAVGESVGEYYMEALKPLLDIQERNSEILQKLIARELSPAIMALTNQNNLYVTKAIDDILAIRLQEIARLTESVRTIDFAWLNTDLTRINQAFLHLFADRYNNIEISGPLIQLSKVAEKMVLPSATVSFYTDSARSIVEADTENKFPELQDMRFESFGDKDLDLLLYDINPDFVEMRQRSWAALHVAGPDRLRHAATSQRELIRQLLTHLVPDAFLPDDNKVGPQLKTRVKISLGVSESDAAFIDSIANAVFNYYSQLNKYTHHNIKHEEGLKAILHTGEGLIRFIIQAIKT